MTLRDMIATHPDVAGPVNEALLRAAEACLDCDATCMACADACLAEPAVERLRHCIRLDLDCAEICRTTAVLALRRTASDAALIRMALVLCADICRACGEECAHHADRHAHCRICSETCRACETACRAAAESVTPG